MHSCACMWKCLFKELRGLTNTTNMLNPVELNDLYDHMWNVGVILQSDEPLAILAVDFRPWPRFRANEARSQSFYERLERNKTADLTELRRFETREDQDIYRPILIETLNLFGLAIHTSLERTLGHYLKATDGMFRNELRDDWQLEKVSALLCTNNPAERPFAVAKAYLNIYQSLSLRTLASFSLSMCNGSHRPAESQGKQERTRNKAVRQCGTALTAPTELQQVITRLCSVKRVNIGQITAKLDLKFETNTLSAAELRARKQTKTRGRGCNAKNSQKRREVQQRP